MMTATQDPMTEAPESPSNASIYDQPDFPIIELDFGDGMDWRDVGSDGDGGDGDERWDGGLDLEEPEPVMDGPENALGDDEPTIDATIDALPPAPVAPLLVGNVPAASPTKPAKPTYHEAWTKAWDQIESLESQIINQDREVLAQHMVVTRLEGELKDARKRRKEATEEKVWLEVKLADAKIAMDELRDEKWQGDYSREFLEYTDGTSLAAGLGADAVGSSPSAASSTEASEPGNLPTTTATSATAARRYTPEDPALTTDIWVLKSKLYGGGATNAQIEKLNGEDVRTIANLEEYMRGGLLVPGRVKGLGQAAVDKVTDALMAWRKGNPVPVEIEVADEPMVAMVAAEVQEASASAGPSTPAAQVETVSEVIVTCEGDPEFAAAATAYIAGSSAASANQPVSTNPHERGTQLWLAWDRGWQECDNL